MPRKQDGKTGRVTCHIKIKLLDRSKLLEETKNSGWKKHRCNFCGKGFNTKMLVDRHTYVCAKTRRTRTGLRKQSINSNRIESTNHKYKLRKFTKSTNSNNRKKQQPTSDNDSNDNDTTESENSSDEQEHVRALRSTRPSVTRSSRFNKNVLRRRCGRSGTSDIREIKDRSQAHLQCKMCSKRLTSRMLLTKHVYFCLKAQEKRKNVFNAYMSLNGDHKYTLRDRGSLSGSNCRKIDEAVKTKDSMQNDQSSDEQSHDENNNTSPETISTSKKKGASECKKCSKEFSTKILLLKHARFCAKCQHVKKSLGTKAAHKRLVTNHCKYTLRKRRQVGDSKRTKRHKNKHHVTSASSECDENQSDSDHTFSCILCARSFGNKRSLIEHVRFCLTAVNRKNTLRMRSSESELKPEAPLPKSPNIVNSESKLVNNSNDNNDDGDSDGNSDHERLPQKKARTKEKKNPNPLRVKTFHCKMCEREFHSKLSLVRHVRFSRQCVQAVERRKSLRIRISSKTNPVLNPTDKHKLRKRRVSGSTKGNLDKDDGASSVRGFGDQQIKHDGEVKINDRERGDSDAERFLCDLCEKGFSTEAMMSKHKELCLHAKKSQKTVKRKRLGDDSHRMSDANYKFKLRRSTILSVSRDGGKPFSDEDLPMPDITSDNANKSPERTYWGSDDSGDWMPDITHDTAEVMDESNKNYDGSEVTEREDPNHGNSEIVSKISKASEEELSKATNSDIGDIEQDENRKEREEPGIVSNAATVSDEEEAARRDIETSDVAMEMEIFRCKTCNNLYATTFMFDKHAQTCAKKHGEAEQNREAEAISIPESDSESEAKNDQDDMLEDVLGNGDDFISESEDEGSEESDSEDSLLDESDVEMEIFICKLCNKMFDAEANLDSHLKRCKKAPAATGVTASATKENQENIPQFMANGEGIVEYDQKESNGGTVVTLTHGMKGGEDDHEKDELLPNQMDEKESKQNGPTIGLETKEPEKTQDNLCEKIGKFAREGKNDVHSSRKQGIYLCETCDKQFNVKGNFEAHRVHCKTKAAKRFSEKPTIFSETKEDPQCQFCHNWFSAEFLLVRHLLEFHAVRKRLPEPPFVTFECMTCKALFSTLDEFSFHQCDEHANPEIQSDKNNDDNDNKSIENHGNNSTTSPGDINNNEINEKEDEFKTCDADAEEEEEYPTVTSQVETPRSGILTGTAKFRRCDVCFQTFENEKQCQTHSCLSAKPLQKVTKIAMSSTLNDGSLSQDMTRYLCNVCYRVFEAKNQLRTHVEQCKTSSHMVLEFGIGCRICSKRFTGNYWLKKHMEDKHGLKFECNQCKESFISVDTLNRHKCAASMRRGKNYRCKECRLLFPTEHAYRKHWAETHGKNSLYCESCHQRFSHQVKYEEHVVICGAAA